MKDARVLMSAGDLLERDKTLFWIGYQFAKRTSEAFNDPADAYAALLQENVSDGSAGTHDR